ncbi:MAG: cytochrome c [Gammaproteobacteria bacterium]|nr:cytochrome c [Gammaproteobacteria bacterium]
MLFRFSTTAALATIIGIGALGLSNVAYSGNDSTAGDPSRGAKAWADNCMRCHNARGAKEFRDDVWKPVVFHMRVRGGLTGQQTRDILAFMQASN